MCLRPEGSMARVECEAELQAADVEEDVLDVL